MATYTLNLDTYLVVYFKMGGKNVCTTRLHWPCHAERIEVAQLTIYMTSNIVDLWILVLFVCINFLTANSLLMVLDNFYI